MRSARIALFIVVTVIYSVPGSAQSCVQSPPGLLDWWPGDDNGTDIAGPNSVTLLNGATFSRGIVGSAFSFDGIDDDADIAAGALANIPVAGNFTVDFWFNPTTSSLSGFHTLFQRERSYVYLHNGVIKSAIAATETNTGISAPANRWTHVAVTYDNTLVTIYVNGALSATATRSLEDQSAFKTGIGYNSRSNIEYYSGLMDEIDFFNRALSASEIQALFNAGSFGKCKPQTTEYFNQAAFAADAGLVKIIGFDTIPAGDNALAGTEFVSDGLTIQQRDGWRINIVGNTVPSSYGPNFVTQANINSAPNAISSSIFVNSASADISDNFNFIFSQPGPAAGLFIGNLGKATVEMLDSNGGIIASEALSPSHTGILVGQANVAWDNRIFYGVLSATPIAQIRVTNGPFDGDGITLDDIQFTPLNRVPIANAVNRTVAADALTCVAQISVDDRSSDPDGDPITVVQEPPGPYPLGSTNVLLIVTDDKGGRSVAQAVVTVIDTAAPRFTTIPSALTVETTDPSGIAVNLGTPAVLDCQNVILTNNAPAVFPIGTTRVTFTAVDASKNTSFATTDVTVVLQNRAPVASPQSVITNEDTSVTITLQAADADGDPLTFTISSNPSHGTLSGNGAMRIYTPNTDYNGQDSFTFTASDGRLSSASATVDINVTPINDVPVMLLGGNASINEGSTFTRTGSFSDPDADSWTASVDYGDGSAVESLALNSKTFTLSHVYRDNNTYNVTVTVNDNAGGIASGSLNVVVGNVAPAVSVLTLSASAIVENDSILLTGTFRDPGALDSHNVTINWGDGSAPTSIALAAGVLTFSAPHQFLDDAPSGTAVDPDTITVVVVDKDGGSGGGNTALQISNVSPIITSIAGPVGPLALASAAPLTVDFTDVGSQDTHSCTITWDDGQTTTVAAPAAGNGSCSMDHTYSAAGVYTVGISVLDDDTGTATQTYQFIVVYDPNAGFVTGGGWIDSPAGAYPSNPGLSGRANFGFVSKYQKGAATPTGQTEFEFRLANFNFHSTAYDWLVVAGRKAQYKGSGSVNGSGNYGFLLTATDGDLPGGTAIDQFRIKIWDVATGAIVYDNAMGTSDDIDNAQPQAISGGSIVIHSN